MQRNESNLSPEDQANDCNISIYQISRIESGEINTTIFYLFVFAKTLNIEIKNLFNFK
jgi:transcriptional regulator with XRE-family HTH domain